MQSPRSPLREPMYDAVSVSRSYAREMAASEGSSGLRTEERLLVARLRRLTAKMGVLAPSIGMFGADKNDVGIMGSSTEAAPAAPASPRAHRTAPAFPCSIHPADDTPPALAKLESRVARVEVQLNALVQALGARIEELEQQVESVDQRKELMLTARARHQRAVDRVLELPQTPPQNGQRGQWSPDAAPSNAYGSTPRTGWRGTVELETRQAALLTQQAELKQVNHVKQAENAHLKNELDNADAERQHLRLECNAVQQACSTLSLEVSALRDHSRGGHCPLPLSIVEEEAAESAIDRALVKLPPPAPTSSSTTAEEAAAQADGWLAGWCGEKWIESSIDCGGIVAASLMSRLRARFEDGQVNPSAEKAFFAELGRENGPALIEALLKEGGELVGTLASAIANQAQVLCEDKALEAGNNYRDPPPAATAVSSSRATRISRENPQGGDIMAKFVDDDARELVYGGAASFFRGLTGRVGLPHGSHICAVRMRAEHCHFEPASSTLFVAANYGIETTTTIEYWFVVDPLNTLHKLRLREWPQPQCILGESATISQRAPRPLEDFTESLNCKNEALRAVEGEPMTRDELIATRLYTGPCFVAYNKVLRDTPGGVASPQVSSPARLHTVRAFRDTARLGPEEKHVNPFSATLHCISSAIGKLSKLSRVTKVYRAPGGKMPTAFMEPDPDTNGTGGIESGFMSCTSDFDQARHYALASQGAKIVYEVHQGLVSRGAEISWLSQFPAEAECLFPPFSALEVIQRTRRPPPGANPGDNPEDEPSTRTHGGLLIISLRVSVASDLAIQIPKEEAREGFALQIIRSNWRGHAFSRHRRQAGATAGKLQRFANSRERQMKKARALRLWRAGVARQQVMGRAASFLLHEVEERAKHRVIRTWVHWLTSYNFDPTSEQSAFKSDLCVLFRRRCGTFDAELAVQQLRAPQLRRSCHVWHRYAVRSRRLRASAATCRGSVWSAMHLWRHVAMNRKALNAARAIGHIQASDDHALALRALRESHCAELAALRAELAELRSELLTARMERDVGLVELGLCDDERAAAPKPQASIKKKPPPPPMARQTSFMGTGRIVRLN